MRPRQPASALKKAMDLLAARACTERELLEKLRRGGYADSEVRQAVEECRRRGYLNDALLAEDQSRFLSERGCGSRLIREKLRRRGVDPEVVDLAVGQSLESEAEALRTALEYKLRLLGRESDPRRKREKAFRFLISRGFSPELVINALDKTDLE